MRGQAQIPGQVLVTAVSRSAIWSASPRNIGTTLNLYRTVFAFRHGLMMPESERPLDART